jgi:hypothetical protein
MFRVRLEIVQKGTVLVEAENAEIAVRKARQSYEKGNVRWEPKVLILSASPNNSL